MRHHLAGELRERFPLYAASFDISVVELRRRAHQFGPDREQGWDFEEQKKKVGAVVADNGRVGHDAVNAHTYGLQWAADSGSTPPLPAAVASRCDDWLKSLRAMKGENKNEDGDSDTSEK